VTASGGGYIFLHDATGKYINCVQGAFLAAGSAVNTVTFV
jgi:uncharacterized protein (AIM24 family)